MVKGEISKTRAIIFATVIGIVGVLILALHTNLITLGIALIGIFFYLVLYTPLKRKNSLRHTHRSRGRSNTAPWSAI